TKIARAVSVSTVPRTTTRPSSGLSSPAATRAAVVLPEPDGPNSATRPCGGAAKAMSKTVSPSRCRNATVRPSSASDTGLQTLGNDLAEQERAGGEHDRHQRQPRGRRLAARRLQRGVDRQRQRLRAARDVGGEGDHGSELAERGGEADDRGD